MQKIILKGVFQPMKTNSRIYPQDVFDKAYDRYFRRWRRIRKIRDIKWEKLMNE